MAREIVSPFSGRGAFFLVGAAVGQTMRRRRNYPASV
jgi:hypothetical protein